MGEELFTSDPRNETAEDYLSKQIALQRAAEEARDRRSSSLERVTGTNAPADGGADTNVTAGLHAGAAIEAKIARADNTRLARLRERLGIPLNPYDQAAVKRPVPKEKFSDNETDAT